MAQIKKVNLFVRVKQNLKEKIGGSTQDFEFFTTGKLKKLEKKWVVEYENEYNGLSKIILNENGTINVIANGDLSYNLKLKKDKKTKFSCKTKDTFSFLNVLTKKVYFEFNEKNEGKIDLEYYLEIDDVGGGMQNKILIDLK